MKLPGGMNIQQMMQQAQKMQEQMSAGYDGPARRCIRRVAAEWFRSR
jgi:hypothetical protein